MRKGKFHLVLCFYPIVAFACVILQQPVLCALVLGLCVFLEKDEWAGRQTLQAWILSLVVSFFSGLVPWAVSLFTISFVSDFLSTAASVVSAIVYAGAIVLSILGMTRVLKDQEANLPLLSDLAYRAYGMRAPKPMPGQYPPPFTPQYPGQPPVPPQNGQPPYSGSPSAEAPQSGGSQNGDNQP